MRGKLHRAAWPQGSPVALGALVVLVVCSLALVALDVAGSHLSRRSVATGLSLLVLMPAVLLGQYAPPPYRLPYRWRWGLLMMQVLLTYLPLLLFHYRWLSLLGFLAGAVLLTLPPTSSVPIALLVGASGPLIVHTDLVRTDRGAVSVLLSTAITASTVFAVGHLALLSARLHAGREQAARLAEQRARALMRQDLHDLAGSSLSAIVVQGEAALRGPVPADTAPDAARRALTEIVGLARRLHTEIRAIGQPDDEGPSLSEELAHAQRVLHGSGIAVRTALSPCAAPDPEVSACLRFVLREAVGNVLQHSRAAVCEIELRSDASGIRLLIRNDGALAPDAPPQEPGRRGTGLSGLGYRAHTLGGTFAAGREDDSFTVEALLPTA
ncbi:MULTISPECIES: sensor histidine kinase [Streptomyces]|uniref:Histidine kinase n=1 Tax=Streptomyces glycanivorans TaxID=3033808 RepID=A0ABY9JD10_9ACTN|nr:MULTISPECIES: histidine kinase [unclassified Streptomyces]WLQ64719.1 histidine kinase [Streptomyces sp. Alt3]WSQ78103.1 histidine kinase [Streptomyces sp. NBC_01213]WSR08434.1 histidine kinase [Streptomyces sp. NBC_01208]WSR48818.1 histidine kinase [Streptomyces sp. NBC_01201]